MSVQHAGDHCAAVLICLLDDNFASTVSEYSQEHSRYSLSYGPARGCRGRPSDIRKLEAVHSVSCAIFSLLCVANPLQVHLIAQHTRGHSATALYGFLRCAGYPLILVSDVVVPIPLPLSAILILVIDLGFELFVAVRLPILMQL